MNAIKNELAGSASTPAVRRLAAATGLEPEPTRIALAAMIDALSARLERNTLSRGGLAEAVRAIGDPRRQLYLGDPDAIGSERLHADGEAILGHILGSRDASRGVAARAARAAGIPAAAAEQMLPTVAAMLMGEVARAAQGPFDDILRRVPGLDDALKEIGGRLGKPDGAGRGGDAHSDDGGLDAQRPARAGLPEQRPLPLPGEVPRGGGSRYDDLSDVLERGGFKLPKGGGGSSLPPSLPGDIPAGGGGTLNGIVRAILAALLGFQSRGIVGWLVRLVVLRWGWGFVQRILGSVLGRVLLGR